MSAGIDYGLGMANIDYATGIRYGVIQTNHVGQYWYDASESDYGSPTCGYCGSDDITEDDTKPYSERWACSSCGKTSSEDEIWSDEPIAHTYSDGEYDLQQGGDDADIFVLRSPYYTLCDYCSPCAPGAGYLESQDADGIKAYCLGPEWFEDDAVPYAVYRVDDNSLVTMGVQE